MVLKFLILNSFILISAITDIEICIEKNNIKYDDNAIIIPSDFNIVLYTKFENNNLIIECDNNYNLYFRFNLTEPFIYNNLTKQRISYFVHKFSDSKNSSLLFIYSDSNEIIQLKFLNKKKYIVKFVEYVNNNIKNCRDIIYVDDVYHCDNMIFSPKNLIFKKRKKRNFILIVALILFISMIVLYTIYVLIDKLYSPIYEKIKVPNNK